VVSINPENSQERHSIIEAERKQSTKEQGRKQNATQSPFKSSASLNFLSQNGILFINSMFSARKKRQPLSPRYWIEIFGRERKIKAQT